MGPQLTDYPTPATSAPKSVGGDFPERLRLSGRGRCRLWVYRFSRELVYPLCGHTGRVLLYPVKVLYLLYGSAIDP